MPFDGLIPGHEVNAIESNARSGTSARKLRVYWFGLEDSNRFFAPCHRQQ